MRMSKQLAVNNTISLDGSGTLICRGIRLLSRVPPMTILGPEVFPLSTMPGADFKRADLNELAIASVWFQRTFESY